MLNNEYRKYRDFFEKIKKFQKEQQMQKKRGLNDYNMVNVVRKENAEVGMHSNVIYSLIDPNGLHYQDDLFLKLFIEEVLTDIKNDFGKVIAVSAEEPTYENRRIDLTIKSTNYYVGIEMKIDAVDLQDQLSDYQKDLIEKAKKDNNQEVIIYYLTRFGKEAASYSSNKITYKKISFKEHILNWINRCQKEVYNITNLNMAFENYKDIVKKITNQYKGKVMSLKDELLKNDEYFELAKDISKAFQEAQAERNMQLKTEKINLIINLLENQNIKNYCPKWCAIDIIANYTIRIIANDNNYLIQIFDKDGYGREFDQKEKQPILNKLQIIDKRFKSAYSKVYGQMEYDYDNIKLDSIKSLITELINLG